MGAIGMAQAVLRSMHMAALISLFGTLIFLTVVAPAAMVEAAEAAAQLRLIMLRIARISLAGALFIGMAWLMVEVVVIAGTDSLARTLHALPVVALRTQFGHWLLLRLLLLLVAIPLLAFQHRGVVATVVLAGTALVIQPFLGHAGAIGGSVGNALIASEGLHLLAASAWLGSLPPLFILIGALPHDAAATACRSFTPVGLAAVLILGGTAVLQVSELMGGLPGLLGTGYGQFALIKIGLFVGLLALAALNRLALTDQLDGATPAAARHHMRLSIATEAVLGALIVIIAGFLASLTPGLHQQPVWPFSWRPSFDALSNPDLRREIIGASVAIAGAVGVAMLAANWHRGRWPLMGAVLVILSFAVPHFDLLVVQAYPTSYFTSPTEFAVSAIAHGARLYQTHCMGCHGVDGRGNGPDAGTLPIRPADLTAGHLGAHSDGELFWFLSHGIDNPEGGLAMPGFAGTLSSDARWHLIDYLRARNAGESVRQLGVWPQPVPVPQFDAKCADRRTIDLDDLRGRMLRIVVASGEDQPSPMPPLDVDLATIVVTLNPAIKLDATACVMREPAAWMTFAIIAGVSPAALGGTQLLADSNHWLRVLWRSGEVVDPQSLMRKLRDIAARPIPSDRGGGHAHQH